MARTVWNSRAEGVHRDQHSVLANTVSSRLDLMDVRGVTKSALHYGVRCNCAYRPAAEEKSVRPGKSKSVPAERFGRKSHLRSLGNLKDLCDAKM